MVLKDDNNNVDQAEEKYNKCSSENKTLKKSPRFKSDKHNLPIVKVNKITMSSNNRKRMQSFDCSRTFQGIVNEHLHMEHPK